MDKGKKVSEGSHGELLEDCELYQSMWDAHQETKAWHFGQSLKGEETITVSEGVESC
jgi:ATP-binding cassette subfamily B protein